ncbi:MAG: SusC/RagA family TonB-linked outer membrane protein [Ferruginibacter sp.]
MKLTAFVLLIACLQARATGHAQDKITLTLKDAALKEALVSIQRVSNYRFIYNDDLLPGNAKVNLSATNASIDEVMNNVLQSTALTYKLLENNLIVLSADERKSDYQVNITGTVSLRKDGETILQKGISVLEKGTDNGTMTDEGGRFSLTVQKPDAVLQVSYVGFKKAEVALNGRTTVDVVLEADVKEMEGVVVTALGITRQKRTLTYSAQTLGGNDLSNSREANITSAMNGKVAGLTISKTNSGPGSSNRIIFRGNRSITGNNQPLIVVDGVRIDNTPQAFNDVSYNVGLARDNGDGISNLNPDDIESMTVLTGASASALYGSDASNGVVIVTTKKGRAGKGIGVQVSSSVMFETPMLYPKFQDTYGQGQGGTFNKSGDLSWGPAMTGQPLEDWTGKTQALTPQPDNFKDFFVTGKEFINTVALSAGTEKSQTYFSYTNTSSKGILPNNDYKRNNLNLRQTTQITKNLSIDLKANYLEEDIKNRPLAGGGNHAMTTLYSMPRSLRLDNIKNFETTDLSTLTPVQNYWGPLTPAFENPYWAVYRNLYQRKRNRFIGLVALKYIIAPGLSIQARTSLDHYTDDGEEKDYNGSPWLTTPGQGNYILNKASFHQFNNDVLITFNKNITADWNVNVNAGAGIEQFKTEGINANAQGLNIANSFSLGNGAATVSLNSLARTEKQSLYIAAQVGFKNYLFVDLTGRNDWNSTLPVQNASYFFPSAGLSAILNEMLQLPAVVSLLKVRASYAYVGNGTGFNQLKQSPYIGPGGNGGFLFVDRLLHNANLKPEETRSFEAGVDFQLFNNRFGAQLTYYKTNTINQILQIDVPNPSGYAFRIINAGNIRNNGIEALINATPIETKNFRWNVLLNFGSNKNKILYLDSLQKMPPLSSPETLGMIVAEEGKSFGGIYTTSFVRNNTGQVVVDVNGLPLVEGDQTKFYAGNYNPDWTAGITNTFQYKNWALSFLIDERKGGIVISGTQALMAEHGASLITVPDRLTGFVVPNSVTETGDKNAKLISVEDYWRYVGGSNLVGEAFINSATNVRLREASISYEFPANRLGKTFIKGLKVSLVGRNLFFLKNNAYGFDPETALGTGNNQGLEYTPVPSTRSYGVYLKLNF